MVMVNMYGKPGKHGRLGGLGDLPDLDGIGPATGHSIPCTSWMIYTKHEKIARSDPEEGVRTVRYGSNANLGSA
jgi:hypothetical protein